MKSRKDSAIAFGITLAAANRTGDANTHLQKKGSTVRHEDSMLKKTAEAAADEFDFPRRNMPAPDKQPFTPDLFTCEPVPLPAFPPRRMSREEARVHKALGSFQSRTASHPASGKSSPTAGAVAWEFFKVVFAGVFLAFKYLFIAVAVIITIGCMMCAGRQTGGLR